MQAWVIVQFLSRLDPSSVRQRTALQTRTTTAGGDDTHAREPATRQALLERMKAQRCGCVAAVHAHSVVPGARAVRMHRLKPSAQAA